MRTGIGIRVSNLGSGGGWRPTALSGCVLWLRADMGITLNGSNVSAWADQSGQGNNLTQGSAGAQPAFEASGYNGKPSVAFDGTADWLGGTGASLLAAASGDDVAQTVFFACQRTASATDVWFRWDHSTGLGIHQVYHAANNLVAYRQQDSGASSNPTINTGGVDANRARWILVYSGTAWTVYKNGTPTGPTACNTAAATLDQYALGGDRAAANAAALRVAEHGVYNRAITAAEAAQLDAYLAGYG